MDFFTKVLSASGSNRSREKAKEAEQANQNFKENLDNLKSRLESEESSDVIDVLDMVYDDSFPEDKVFLKTPSRARLRSKKELVVRLLLGLDSLGVPAMAEMLVFTKKYGPEEIADSLMTLLDCLSPLLEGKEAPQFSTDDVMDAMDLEWHSTSGKGSPLLNMFASAASSPRASAASLGDSPLHPMFAASPYRRAISDRSMLVSRAQEVSAKPVREKTFIGASTPPRSSLSMSVSPPYPSADQDFRFSQPTIPENPVGNEITQFSIDDEKPSSYSLDTVPGLQRIHRRKSSSLKELFAEDANDELRGEGAAGASTKRNSSSSSWRRNSSELKRLLSNISGTSSPRKSGVAAVDSKEEASVAPEKELLSSIQYQDKDANRSSRKGSSRVSPSPPPDEVALWREDSGGFSVDLTSSIKSADQTVDSPPIHSKPSVEIHHGTEERGAAEEVSPIPEDSIKSSKSINLEQKDISNATSGLGNESSEPVKHTNKLASDEDKPRDFTDVNSTEEPSEIEGMTENQMKELRQDADEHTLDYNQLVIEDQLNKDAPGAALGDSVQTKQSNVLRHGYHTRSNSDLTPVKSFLKAESSKQEKLTPQRRSQSDAQAKMGKLRKFARHISSLKASMESLRSRGGSGETAVKQETMVSTEDGQQREELASEEHEKGSLSDAASDKSTSSSSSSSSSLSGSSGRAKASLVDERPSALHHLETEEYAVDDDGALKPHEPELGLQRNSDGDVHEDAREVQLLLDHKEDAGQAVSSSDKFFQDGGDSLSTHEELDAGIVLASQKDGDHVHLGDNPEEDAGHTRTHVQYPGGEEDVRLSSHSSDEEAEHGFTHEEVEVHRHTLDDNARHEHSSGTRDLDAGNSHILDPDQQDAVHAHTHDDNARQAHSSGTQDLDAGTSQIVDPDQQDGSKTASDKTTSEGTSIVGNAFQWILAPFLPSSNVSQDADGQAGDTPSLPLKDDKGLDNMGSLSSEEREDPSSEGGGDKALHPALSPHEDLQTTPKTGDVESSGPLQGQGQVNVQYESHRDEPVWSSVGDKTDTHLSLTHSSHGNSDGSTESLSSVSSIDAAALAGDVGFTDSNKQSDDQNALHRVETDELLQKLPSLDAFDTTNTTSADSADSKSTSQAPLYLASSLPFEEMGTEEILRSKDDEASMQKALETKDDAWPKEVFNESTRSLDEGDYFTLDTDSVNNVSLNENVELEKPELLGEDEKKENLQPLEGHVEAASGPPAEVEENPKVSADQFEKSFLRRDAADEGVYSNGRELPLVSNAEAGEMGLDDKTMKEILVEDSTRGQLDKEEMQAIMNEMLSKEKSEGESLENVVQSTDESARAKQVMMDAIARRRLEEYLRSAAEEERADAGSSTVDTAGDRDMPAGFMGHLVDHENQQGKKEFNVSPLSKKADPPGADYANLHGHPTSSSSSTSSHVDSPRKSGQHVQATFSDPTMDKWEMDKRSTSKRKGGRLGKWARNYLQCFSKPQTKSHHKTPSV